MTQSTCKDLFEPAGHLVVSDNHKPGSYNFIYLCKIPILTSWFSASALWKTSANSESFYKQKGLWLNLSECGQFGDLYVFLCMSLESELTFALVNETHLQYWLQCRGQFSHVVNKCDWLGNETVQRSISFGIAHIKFIEFAHRVSNPDHQRWCGYLRFHELVNHVTMKGTGLQLQ